MVLKNFKLALNKVEHYLKTFRLLLLMRVSLSFFIYVGCILLLFHLVHHNVLNVPTRNCLTSLSTKNKVKEKERLKVERKKIKSRSQTQSQQIQNNE